MTRPLGLKVLPVFVHVSIVMALGGDISVWSTARQIIEPLILGGKGVRGTVSTNPDRRLLVIKEENGRMTAWSWPDRAKVCTAPLVVDGSASFSPDGGFVAVPSQGHRAP